jgi:hypothetical protein
MDILPETEQEHSNPLPKPLVPGHTDILPEMERVRFNPLPKLLEPERMRIHPIRVMVRVRCNRLLKLLELERMRIPNTTMGRVRVRFSRLQGLRQGRMRIRNIRMGRVPVHCNLQPKPLEPVLMVQPIPVMAPEHFNRLLKLLAQAHTQIQLIRVMVRVRCNRQPKLPELERMRIPSTTMGQDPEHFSLSLELRQGHMDILQEMVPERFNR